MEIGRTFFGFVIGKRVKKYREREIFLTTKTQKSQKGTK